MDPLEQAIRERFGKVSKQNNFLYFACPTCVDEKHARKRRRWIDVNSLTSNCWICHKELQIEDLTGLRTFERIKRADKPVEEEKEDPLAKVLPCYETIPVNQLPHDHPAIKFLAKDHLFDYERYYTENKIVYCPTGQGKTLMRSPFVTASERLIFPVYFKGDMVGWQMRSIPGTFYGDRADCLRYYHKFNKGKYLYNYDNAQAWDMVVVVEGVKKALKFPNGVATLGTGIADEQVKLLTKWKKITFMLDGEDAAQAKARELTRLLNAGTSTVKNIDPRDFGFVSPDDKPEEELWKVLHQAWNQP